MCMKGWVGIREGQSLCLGAGQVKRMGGLGGGANTIPGK